MGLHAEQAKIYNQIGLTYINKIPLNDAYGVDKLITIDYNLGSSSFVKAKKNFKKAKMILEENNLVESESVLYKSIHSNLKTRFKDFK